MEIIDPIVREANGDLLRRTHPHDENWRRLQKKLKAAYDMNAAPETLDAIRAEIRQSEYARSLASSAWYHEWQERLAAK
jgi:hypothetical protein